MYCHTTTVVLYSCLLATGQSGSESKMVDSVRRRHLVVETPADVLLLTYTSTSRIAEVTRLKYSVTDSIDSSNTIDTTDYRYYRSTTGYVPYSSFLHSRKQEGDKERLGCVFSCVHVCIMVHTTVIHPSYMYLSTVY